MSKKAKKAKKVAPKRAGTGRKRADASLMTAAAATAHADQTGKEYFKSLPKGTWIECDWDAEQQIYDNCHPVPASQVPRAWGGDRP
jgi:hypothetical protein